MARQGQEAPPETVAPADLGAAVEVVVASGLMAGMVATAAAVAAPDLQRPDARPSMGMEGLAAAAAATTPAAVLQMQGLVDSAGAVVRRALASLPEVEAPDSAAPFSCVSGRP